MNQIEGLLILFALPLCLHPVNPCGIERMRNYHLRNLVGNPHEAAIAARSTL